MEFNTNDLASKFGFQDGDIMFQLGIEDRWLAHELLIEVVEKYILPQLDQEISVVYYRTIHNPIRVERIDGVAVSEEGDNPLLTPAVIEVDKQRILSLLDELGSS